MREAVVKSRAHQELIEPMYRLWRPAQQLARQPGELPQPIIRTQAGVGHTQHTSAATLQTSWKKNARGRRHGGGGTQRCSSFARLVRARGRKTGINTHTHTCNAAPGTLDNMQQSNAPPHTHWTRFGPLVAGARQFSSRTPHAALLQQHKRRALALQRHASSPRQSSAASRGADRNSHHPAAPPQPSRRSQPTHAASNAWPCALPGGSRIDRTAACESGGRIQSDPIGREPTAAARAPPPQPGQGRVALVGRCTARQATCQQWDQ
jgi:hypothetical protein